MNDDCKLPYGEYEIVAIITDRIPIRIYDHRMVHSRVKDMAESILRKRFTFPCRKNDGDFGSIVTVPDNIEVWHLEDFLEQVAIVVENLRTSLRECRELDICTRDSFTVECFTEEEHSAWIKRRDAAKKIEEEKKC